MVVPTPCDRDEPSSRGALQNLNGRSPPNATPRALTVENMSFPISVAASVRALQCKRVWLMYAYPPSDLNILRPMSFLHVCSVGLQTNKTVTPTVPFVPDG